MNTYCLGVGSMDLCKTCQHDHNWTALNQMPNALRLSLQKDMTRMDESLCQITSGKLYVSASAGKTGERA